MQRRRHPRPLPRCEPSACPRVLGGGSRAGEDITRRLQCWRIARRTGEASMGTATMGKVIVSAKMENLEDLYAVHQGLLTPDKVRTLDVNDALVDTGAIGLMIPTRLLPTLGLRPTQQRQARSVSGV